MLNRISTTQWIFLLIQFSIRMRNLDDRMNNSLTNVFFNRITFHTHAYMFTNDIHTFELLERKTKTDESMPWSLPNWKANRFRIIGTERMFAFLLRGEKEQIPFTNIKYS